MNYSIRNLNTDLNWGCFGESDIEAIIIAHKNFHAINLESKIHIDISVITTDEVFIYQVASKDDYNDYKQGLYVIDNRY